MALGVAGAALPLTAQAEPVRITGSVQLLPGGLPPDLRAELLPLFPNPAEGDARPEGGQGEPLAAARPDASGRFELVAPAPGFYRIVVRAESWQPRHFDLVPLLEPFTLPPLAPSLRREATPFRNGRERLLSWSWQDHPGSAAADPAGAPLRPTVPVSGRVVDAASGQSIPAAWVWTDPLPFTSVQTGADGKFTLKVPPGWMGRFYAAAAGRVRDEEGVRLALPDGGPPRAGLELRLRSAATGSGQVVDPEGKGVAGALVRVVSPAGPDGSQRRQLRGPDTFTGADGEFRLPGLLPQGSYELSVTHPDFPPQRGVLRTSSPGRTAPPARIVLARGQAVTGRVVDEDGRPLPGAELLLSERQEQPESRTQLFARSREDGSFALRPVQPGTFALRIGQPGRPPLVLDNLIVPAGAAPFDLGILRLERGVTLEGRVVDPAGSPIQGAQVRCIWETTARQPDGSFSRSQPAAESVFTDAEGGFRCGGLSSGGRYSVGAHHPLYADTHVGDLEPPLSQPVQVEMVRARTLAGRVTAGGEPVADATVTWKPAEIEERKTRTDAHGGFAIPKLTPGVADLTVQSPAHRPLRLEGVRIPAAADPAPLEIVLDSGEVLEGRVTDSRGEPVADAWVRIASNREMNQEPGRELPEPWHGPEQLITGPDGRFRLGGLSEGFYRIEAGRRPWQVAVRTTVEVGPGTNRADLALGLESDVAGRVRDQGGEPVPGATVQLTPLGSEAGMYPFSAVTAADGSFHIPFVSPGRFQAEARRKGFAAGAAAPLELAGEAVRDLELRLTRTDQAIAGRLLGLEPADRAQVWILASSASLPDVAGSFDGKEAYRIADLGPGEWKVLAMTAAGRRAEGTVRVAPGVAETSFDLDFETGLSLSGRVLVDRQPLAGMAVYVRNPRRSEAGAVTASDGSFRITGLSPGIYDLEVRSDPPGLRHSQKVSVEPGREVLVEVESGAVNGRITSAAGAPLNGATVELSPADGYRGPAVRTGPDGGYSLPRISPGAYRVRVAKEGFEAGEAELRVRAGGVSVLDVALTPLP